MLYVGFLTNVPTRCAHAL